METTGIQTSKPKAQVTPQTYAWIEVVRNSCQDMSYFDGIIAAGLTFLKRSCTASVGFIAEISEHEDLSNSCKAIPNVMDSPLIMELLKSFNITVDESMKNAVRELLLTNMSEELNWGYFINSFKLTPEDADSSSHIIAFLSSIDFNRTKLLEITDSFVKKLDIMNGIPDVYLKGNKSSLKSWKVSRREDSVVVCNILYVLTKLNINHDGLLSGSYDVIESCLDSLIENGTLICVKNYTNIDIVCFSIGRLMQANKYANSMYKEKLSLICKNRLCSEGNTAISIAARLLAGYYCNLTADRGLKQAFFDQTKKLISFQRSETGAFAKSAFCSVHSTLFLGSKALSTAFSLAALKAMKESFPDIEARLSPVQTE